MIDIKFLRENPEVVKENIRKKFQDQKVVRRSRKQMIFVQTGIRFPRKSEL